MIILRQKTFSYYRDLKQLSGTGNPIRDFFSSPKRLKKVGEISKNSQKQWREIAKENAPGTRRREIADRALIKRIKQIESARDKISRTPWKS